VITPAAQELLRQACRAHVNMLVTGGPGSGKTTFANLLTELIPAEERLVVVEEAKELQVRHERTICLEGAAPANVPIGELLSTASKMRPDWLIVGELSGPAVVRALEIFGHGHIGLTTLHATSVEDALGRLEVLCLKANLGLGLGEIRAMIASALRLITFQERLPSGVRKITQVVELRGVENDRYVLCPLFRYSPASGALEPTGEQPSWA
jgi:pilus assembly protein CpaF